MTTTAETTIPRSEGRWEWLNEARKLFDSIVGQIRLMQEEENTEPRYVVIGASDWSLLYSYLVFLGARPSNDGRERFAGVPVVVLNGYRGASVI